MPRSIAVALAAMALVPFAAPAQVATDGSVGARASLTGPAYAIPDFLGRRVGPNLLHSFSTFNIRAGESATFSGVRTIENIIARITGGLPSTIDGPLRVTAPDASLFLVNPAGLVFGPGASVDVPGSFHASTAHALALADGTVIDMRTASPVTLTAAPPAAFGFDAPGAAIALSGAQLRVREGQRLSLAGGDVTLDASAAGRAAALIAPSGAINLVATRGAGTVAIEGDRLAPSGFAVMGDLAVRGGSAILANEGPARRGGGTVVLRGGDVTLDHAAVEARTRFGDGRAIDIGATGRLAIDASNVLAVTTGAGDAGSLRLGARDIAISGGSLVDTSCDPGCTTGAGGDLTLVAGDSISITGSDPFLPTFVVSNSFGGGRNGQISITAGGTFAMSGTALVQGIAIAGGEGSTITLDTGAIEMSGGAQVDASTRGAGRGGDVVVRNGGHIRIEGARRDPLQNGAVLPSGFFVNTAGAGASGSLVISTATLEVLRGGEISSTAQPDSSGAGGRIAVRASGLVRVAGADAEGKPGAIVANTFATGDAGEIVIEADRVEVEDGGRVQAQTQRNLAFARSGSANTIRIRARELSVANGGQVATSTFNSGNGGLVDIALSGSLRISGSPVAADDTGIFSQTFSSGNGGQVRVVAPDILIERGGIFGGTEPVGVRIGDPGRGGGVEVTATRSLVLRDGGALDTFARAFGGLAGDVAVNVGGVLRIESGGRISTQAEDSDGGNISVAVGGLAVLDGGTIATAVGTGQGGGGNITLSIPTLVLRGAVVSANAFGGPGGNIRIGTQTFFPSADSAVTASSQLGIDGTITQDSPALDPTGELLAPAPVFLDAGAVLAGRCGPRLAGKASSLVVAPRGDASPWPDEMHPVLDGFASGFLTRPAPAFASCRPPAAWREARVNP